MDYSYDFVSGMDGELGTAVGIAYIIYYLFTMGIGLAAYILSSVGLYSIAKRRGITKPWLAWIPVANMWIVGSISDQYRYVSKGQIRNKRKVLVGLELGLIVLVLAMVASAVVAAMTMDAATADGIMLVIGMLAMMLVMVVVALVFYVFYYMAMYDLYTSVNPPYNVVFLVLGIIFNITEPFFIFFNRKKDLGMPPRCDISAAPVVQPEPAPLPQPPIQEPWENVTEE